MRIPAPPQSAWPLSPQQILDHVVKAMRAQGKPSKDEHNTCRYRGDGGTACAAGSLIPDDVYDQLMPDGHGVWPGVVYDLPELKAMTSQTGHDLILQLQLAHDGCAGGSGTHFVEAFESRARVVAQQFNLFCPEAMNVMHCTQDDPMTEQRDQMGQHWVHVDATPVEVDGQHIQTVPGTLHRCPHCKVEFFQPTIDDLRRTP